MLARFDLCETRTLPTLRCETHDTQSTTPGSNPCHPRSDATEPGAQRNAAPLARRFPWHRPRRPRGALRRSRMHRRPARDQMGEHDVKYIQAFTIHLSLYIFCIYIARTFQWVSSGLPYTTYLEISVGHPFIYIYPEKEGHVSCASLKQSQVSCTWARNSLSMHSKHRETSQASGLKRLCVVFATGINWVAAGINWVAKNYSMTQTLSIGLARPYLRQEWVQGS